MKTITGYKFIREDMTSLNGNAKWRLKKWKHHTGRLVMCRDGFHACLTPYQATAFVYGGRFFVVEARGTIIHEKNSKFVAREMRLVKELPAKEIFVEYALRCAWRCLKYYEQKYPKDKRCRNALVVARQYVRHPTGRNKERLDAAWSAASAAESAASAASAAESAARSAASAASAARSAAWSAAESGAWSAASAASAVSAAESGAWSAASAAKEKEIAWEEKTLNNIIQKYQKVRR